jgi:hypothetical protein
MVLPFVIPRAATSGTYGSEGLSSNASGYPAYARDHRRYAISAR